MGNLNKDPGDESMLPSLRLAVVSRLSPTSAIPLAGFQKITSLLIKISYK